MAASLPITCTATMVMASHCVGFTLPGMIEEPGSFSGKRQFAQAAARAGSQPANVIGNLHQRSGQSFQRAAGEDEFVMRGKAANLLGCERKGSPVSSAIFFAARSANSGCAFRPVPTAVPPIARS